MTDYIKSLRQQIGHAPILCCGASVIPVNDDDEILLQKRRDNGSWGYSGGAVELDEIVEDAAKRELFEKTGLAANTLDLFGVFSGPELHYIYPNGDEVSIVDIVYICRDYSGELKAEQNEIAELRFFSIDNLPDNVSPPQRKPLDEYIKKARIAIAISILDNWSIVKELPVEHISNSVWRVGNEYILKSGKRDWLLQSIRLAKALTDHGVSTGQIVPTDSVRDYVDGEQIWMLYRAVKGEPLAIAERFGDKRSEFAFKFGEAIGKLHKALEKIKNTNVADVDLYPHITEWALPKAQVELPDDFIIELRELCPNLPKQLIHRDTHPENIMWDNGEVSGFIDFDIAQRNVRLWDVCYCSTALLPDCKLEERERWFDVLRGLLRGYDSVVALTDAEKRAVFHVICSVQIVFIAWGTGQEKYREMTEKNREMLSFVIRSKERICGLI